MERHPAKRVEIVIEAVMERRLTEALTQAGVTGFTVLPVRGGSGRSGPWSREGQVGRTGMVAVVAILRAERVDEALDAVMKVLSRQIGVVNLTDCEVMRAERF